MKRLACLLVLFVVCPLAVAAGTQTLGYVDMQQVIERSKLGKQAHATLKKQFSGPQEALAKEEQAIRKLQDSTNRDAALMSEAELEKRKNEIQERILKLQRSAAAAQQELSREQAKLGAGIIKPAQGIIDKLAKEKKLQAVFERNQSGLLYVADSLDLTDEVIRRLDAETK